MPLNYPKNSYNPNSVTQLISTIAIAMGASWVSGINLYACVGTLGLLGRFANLHDVLDDRPGATVAVRH